MHRIVSNASDGTCERMFDWRSPHTSCRGLRRPSTRLARRTRPPHPALSPVSSRTRSLARSNSRLTSARRWASSLTSPLSLPARLLDLAVHARHLELQALHLEHRRSGLLAAGLHDQLRQQRLSSGSPSSAPSRRRGLAIGSRRLPSRRCLAARRSSSLAKCSSTSRLCERPLALLRARRCTARGTPARCPPAARARRGARRAASLGAPAALAGCAGVARACPRGSRRPGD